METRTRWNEHWSIKNRNRRKEKRNEKKVENSFSQRFFFLFVWMDLEFHFNSTPILQRFSSLDDSIFNLKTWIQTETEKLIVNISSVENCFEMRNRFSQNSHKLRWKWMSKEHKNIDPTHRHESKRDFKLKNFWKTWNFLFSIRCW